MRDNLEKAGFRRVDELRALLSLVWFWDWLRCVWWRLLVWLVLWLCGVCGRNFFYQLYYYNELLYCFGSSYLC